MAMLRSHGFSATLASFALVVTSTVAIAVLGGGQALAGPVNCGDTITADTTLDSDLLDCPNNGIVIGANDITLDLNGHIIDGDNALVDACPEDEFCDVGVANDGHNGVKITNGTVREFAIGVFLFGARTNGISDLSTVKHVFGGILLVQTVRTKVRAISTSGNAGPDSGVGITLFESHNNRVANNRSFDNAELGIHLIGSNHNHIVHNRVRDNPEDGIILEGSGNRIVGNRLVGNSIGITAFSKRGRTVGNVARRNWVRLSGIYVDCCVPKRTVIKRNHVFRSPRSGIQVLSPATTLTRNEARHNGRLGIRAVEGVIDGGGNRASGNGNPRQCVNVVCN